MALLGKILRNVSLRHFAVAIVEFGDARLAISRRATVFCTNKAQNFAGGVLVSNCSKTAFWKECVARLESTNVLQSYLGQGTTYLQAAIGRNLQRSGERGNTVTTAPITARRSCA